MKSLTTLPALAAVALSAALSLALSSHPRAHAFTLERSSSQRGWASPTLSIYVNPTGCGISENELNTAVDTAIALWNSVPTSSLQLSRASETSSTTVAQAVAGSAGSSIKTPLIVCDTALTTTIGSDANLIPAGTVYRGDDESINYSFILLNSMSSAKSRIAALDATRLATVIAHELGHVLGLGHATDERALMYYSSSLKTVLSLGQDDIEGISFLYPRLETRGSGLMGCSTAAAAPQKSIEALGSRSPTFPALELLIYGAAAILARRRLLLLKARN